MKKILLVFLFLGNINQIFSERIIYDKISRLDVKGDFFLIQHYHNWSIKTEKKRSCVYQNSYEIFSDKNDFSYLRCIDRKTKKTVFFIPSPAFDYIKISEDKKIIVCISKIKLLNPFQIVIFSMKGKVLFAKHISDKEILLNIKEYDRFRFCNQKNFCFLERNGRILKSGKKYIIDCGGYEHFLEGEIKKKFLKSAFISHISKNIFESEYSFVYWYSENNPEIVITKNHLSILDINNERIEFNW
jgi:hypothetical protein